MDDFFVQPAFLDEPGLNPGPKRPEDPARPPRTFLKRGALLRAEPDRTEEGPRSFSRKSVGLRDLTVTLVERRGFHDDESRKVQNKSSLPWFPSVVETWRHAENTYFLKGVKDVSL